MALYGVMLVDDEEAVRQAIASKLEWEKIGFEVIATAENGEEALELVLQHECRKCKQADAPVYNTQP